MCIIKHMTVSGFTQTFLCVDSRPAAQLVTAGMQQSVQEECVEVNVWSEQAFKSAVLCPPV